MAEGTKIPISQQTPVSSDLVLSDDDDDDDAFLSVYRAERLKQMQQKNIVSGVRYGEVIEITCADDFLEAVSDCPHNTPVVSHLYDPGVTECKTINTLLEDLAKRMPFVKFIKLVSGCNDLPVIDRVILPALSVYVDGEVVSILTELSELLGGVAFQDMSSRDIEWLLENSENWPLKSLVN